MISWKFKLLKKDNNLNHIAIILDGNQRWSNKKKINISKGYKEGLNKIDEILKASLDLKINYLTLFTLSSENFKRNSLNLIYDIISTYFNEFIEKIVNEKKIKIKIIGKRENLPIKIIKIFKECEKLTKDNKELELFFAFNYGFKEELKAALLKFRDNININLNNRKKIDELFFLNKCPDPDLLIRTGGYRRLSNFIMYNLTYTELFFTKTLWPDFTTEEFNKIINEYKTINRKYGL